MQGSVLIVDAEPARSARVREALVHDGYEVDIAPAVDDGIDAELAAGMYDVVVADARLDALGRIKASAPRTEVVLLADIDCVSRAMDAVRRGAFDFIERPFYAEDVSLSVACAASRRRGRTPTSPLHFMLKNHEVAG